MPTISRVITSYSAERIGVYKDDKNVASACHVFSLLDIYGYQISHMYMDFESMEGGLQVGNNPTITYKL